MTSSEEIRDWWTQALLGQQTSAHPIFGHDLHVDFDGEVLTLRGEVQTPDQVAEIEQEAHRLPNVHDVLNNLVATQREPEYHYQTVIAVFADAATARLACETVAKSVLYDEDPPDLVHSVEEARPLLEKAAQAAQIPGKAIERYVRAVEERKVLLIDRVPEDDALRIISALEGTSAESLGTFPPEPDALRGVTPA